MRQTATPSFSPLRVSAQARDTLGLEPHDDLSAAKKKFRDLMLRAHPDKGGSAAAAKKLNLAWEEVRNASASALRPPRSTAFESPGSPRAATPPPAWVQEMFCAETAPEVQAIYEMHVGRYKDDCEGRDKLARLALACLGQCAYRSTDLRGLVKWVDNMVEQTALGREGAEVYEHVFQAYRARIVYLYLGGHDADAWVAEATQFANSHGFPTNDLAPPVKKGWFRRLWR